MTTNAMMIKDKKAFFVALALASIIALLFWTQSRFPALDEKAQMGQRTPVSSLAFDIVVPLSPQQTYLERSAASALNWAYTNWKGMTFGLLFAAACWLLLSLIEFKSAQAGPSRSFFYHLKSAFYGGVLGAPLGVCANCSTPIAFGAYRSGRPVAGALALLSSSPTFNFVVFGMALSLLPLQLVFLKYVFVLFYLLLVIPILCWLLPGISLKTVEFSRASSTSANLCELDLPSVSWPKALIKVLRSFWQKLVYILKGTLPFMILAGVLAAFVAELVSFNNVIVDWELTTLIIVAALGAFFPVPIAFDVVISATLLAMGVDISYVAVLFFSLSIFSIYPAFVIAKDISIKLSIYLMLAVIILALGFGLVVAKVSEHQFEKSMASIDKALDGARLEMYESDAELAEADLGIAQTGSELVEAPSVSSANNEYLLDSSLARGLMRKAAKQCHRLGAPGQYRCFERFVIDRLSMQFDRQSCIYLEDAIRYREICNAAYDYLEISTKAREQNSADLCSELPQYHRNACQYDVAFSQVADSQNVVHCMTLSDVDARMGCLTEGLALNFELYENLDACDDIKDSDLNKVCRGKLRELQEQKETFSKRSIDNCLDLESINERRYCQGVLMVNRLENDYSDPVCEQIVDKFLRKRCRDFRTYFSALAVPDESVCHPIPDLELRSECRFNAIQKVLNNEVIKISLEQVSMPSTSDRNGDSNANTDMTVSLEESQVLEARIVRELDGLSVNGASVSVVHVPYFYTDTEIVPNSDIEASSSGPIFKNVSAQAVGFSSPPVPKMIELFEPFSYGRGLSSADWNKDHWLDLVFAHRDHIVFYKNIGGQFEASVRIQFGDELSPLLVLFSDLNDDNWTDLFVSFYGGENRIYWNRKGDFSAKRFDAFRLPGTHLVMSAAVQDLDQDGDVDLVLGGWSYGDLRHFNPVQSANHVLSNRTEKGAEQFIYDAMALKGADGETLSVLLKDFDLDGHTDLIVGNDMDGPDILYRWNGDRFDINTDKSKLLPWLSSFNTMSLASGDLNGDLIPDYFSSDMSFGDDLGRHYCGQAGLLGGNSNQKQEEVGNWCDSYLAAELALANAQVAYCETVSPAERRDCYQAMLIQLAKQSGDVSICEKIKSDTTYRSLCVAASQKLPQKAAFDDSHYLKSSQRNILLLSGSDGYVDSGKEWLAENSGWSWNSLFADVNNDGWLDLLVGNGYLFGGSGRHLQSNALYINQGGEGFERSESMQGFEDYLNMPSFVSFDYDLDGDLDVIGQRVGAEYAVYENLSGASLRSKKTNGKKTNSEIRSNGNTGSEIGGHRRSIQISLRVEGGIERALGSSIVVETDKRSILRGFEIGGGYLSFAQPIAHVGFDVTEKVKKIKITWSDGVETGVTLGEFKDGLYIIDKIKK